MEILKIGRHMGKTALLIYQSHIEQKPIVVAAEHIKKNLINQAKEMNLFIPDPIIIHELKICRGKIKPNEQVLIDDIDLVISQLFRTAFNGINVGTCMCSENDIGKILTNKETTTINLLEEE